MVEGKREEDRGFMRQNRVLYESSRELCHNKWRGRKKGSIMESAGIENHKKKGYGKKRGRFVDKTYLGRVLGDNKNRGGEKSRSKGQSIGAKKREKEGKFGGAKKTIIGKISKGARKTAVS